MSTRLERLIGILNEVNRGSYPTVADLCRKFESKPRTIHDDIRFIKDRLRIEIVFDKNKQGYYNSTPNAKLPEFDLTPDEVLVLMLGKEMFLEYSGATFRNQMEDALKKIINRLVDTGKLSDKEVRDIFQFIPGGVAQTDEKTFRDLRKACDGNLSVQLDYVANYNGEFSSRKVDPYRILEVQGAWYIVGWCHLRNEMRKFAIHRIKDYKILKDKFEIRKEINLDTWIDSAFLFEHRDGEQSVKIRFSPIGARYVLERTWHPSQKVTKHGDGSCTLEFTTQSLDEVKRWVLPYGSAAEVLEPPELRRRLLEELKQALKGYGEAAS